MVSSSTIVDRWWLVTIAGFILVLLFFVSHSRTGYNASMLQKLEVPKQASTPDTIDNREPGKSSEVPFSSGLQDSEPTDFSKNVEPVAVVSSQGLPSLDFQKTRPSNPTAATSSSKHGLKVSKPTKFYENGKPKTKGRCNIFEGKWVYDPEQSPLYDSAKCPFLSERVSCQRNGRPDKEYERWRWEANDCKIPRFDAKDLLERLRGKRVVIVGDSINFGQWESLACLLYSAIPHNFQVDVRKRVFKVESYNLIVEYHGAQFLVDMLVNKTNGKKIMQLDSVSSNAMKWKGADIMIFNTGHWWMGRDRWDWFLFKQELYTDMNLEKAFKLAMSTWARWIEKNVDATKTTVFFRGVSPLHSGHKCYRATQPVMKGEAMKMKLKLTELLVKGVVERTIQGMRTAVAVKYLDITKLTQYRKDAHCSTYWKKKPIKVGPDCSHWCLPGVPDTWNHLLYATMVLDS